MIGSKPGHIWIRSLARILLELTKNLTWAFFVSLFLCFSVSLSLHGGHSCTYLRRIQGEMLGIVFLLLLSNTF